MSRLRKVCAYAGDTEGYTYYEAELYKGLRGMKWKRTARGEWKKEPIEAWAWTSFKSIAFVAGECGWQRVAGGVK